MESLSIDLLKIVLVVLIFMICILLKVIVFRICTVRTVSVGHTPLLSDYGDCTSYYYPCSYVTDNLQPPAVVHSFVVYFCECRGSDAFYELCSALDIPENIIVKIEAENSSAKVQCLDALHRVYHCNGNLTLDMIKAKLSEYSDELHQTISEYHVGV